MWSSYTLVCSKSPKKRRFASVRRFLKKIEGRNKEWKKVKRSNHILGRRNKTHIFRICTGVYVGLSLIYGKAFVRRLGIHIG